MKHIRSKSKVACEKRRPSTAARFGSTTQRGAKPMARLPGCARRSRPVCWQASRTCERQRFRGVEADSPPAAVRVEGLAIGRRSPRMGATRSRPDNRGRSPYQRLPWPARQTRPPEPAKHRTGECKARLYAGFCRTGHPAVTIIRLGARSRARSSHLPAASPSRVIGCLFGVAARRDCPFHPPRSDPARPDAFASTDPEGGIAPRRQDPALRERSAASEPTRLCCSDPHLSVDRCYLLRRSTQSGRSSRGKGPPAIARRTLQRGM